MAYQTKNYFAISLLLLGILSFGNLSVQAKPVIVLAAPENTFVQDISIQVLKKAYDMLGYQIEIRKLPNVRSLVSANMGKFDGEVSRIGNLETNYSNLSAVPTAINAINVVALAQQDSRRINSIVNIKSDVVCVKGIKVEEKLVEANGIQCFFVFGVDQALNMVSLGRAKYTLLPETNARKALLAHSHNNIKIVSPVLHSEKLFHYLHHKNLHIVQPLNRILVELKDSGELDQIRTRFLEDNL